MAKRFILIKVSLEEQCEVLHVLGRMFVYMWAIV